MADLSNRNESNLLPKRPIDRRALAKMQSKLVTTQNRQSKPQLSVYAAEKEPRPGLRAGILILVALLIAVVNVFSYLAKDDLLSKAEPKPVALQAAAPGFNWTPDEKAMYWAYAAYSPAKFEERFGSLPEGQFLDRKKAAREVKALLAKPGLSSIVQADIQALLPSKTRNSALEKPKSGRKASIQ